MVSPHAQATKSRGPAPAVAGDRAGFDAFLSYSHDDSAVARGIQRGLATIGRPFGQLRALRIFRDSTDLTASPDLWGKVKAAMDASRYLLVVLSPSAASSEWVTRELSYWLETKGADHLFLAIAGGILEWNDAEGCFDRAASTAAPDLLTEPGILLSQPFYVDVSQDAPWDPRAPGFRERVTDLAAREVSGLHGVPGVAWTHHRRHSSPASTLAPRPPAPSQRD
jgi:TIR domain